MKVLFVSSSSGSRGGGELYLVYLGRALAARGHEVALWVSNHPRMEELCDLFSRHGRVFRRPYRNTYDYPTRSLAHAFHSASHIAREWKSLTPDMVHVNKQNLEDGLDLLRAAESLPHVTTIHLTQSARFLRAQMAGLRDWIARRALTRNKRPLVCVLEQRARDLATFLGCGARTRVIPNGVDLYDLSQRAKLRTEKRAALGFASDTPVFTAVGRLVPQKRPMLFLELAAQIRAKIPEAHFLWIGDGALASEWDAHVQRHGMNDYVRRLPWQDQVRDHLFASDAFLHTAEFEGLPLALLEAMSAGLPCAITPNLLAEMPFLNQENCIAIQGDWLSTLADREQLARQGKAARRLAEENFSFDLMAQRYEALYRETIAHR